MIGATHAHQKALMEHQVMRSSLMPFEIPEIQNIRLCFSGMGVRSTPARLIRFTFSCDSTKSNSDHQLRQVRYHRAITDNGFYQY